MRKVTKIFVVAMFISSLSAQLVYASGFSDFFTKRSSFINFYTKSVPKAGTKAANAIKGAANNKYFQMIVSPTQALTKQLINRKGSEKAARKALIRMTEPAGNSTAGNSTPIIAFYLLKREEVTRTIQSAGNSTKPEISRVVWGPFSNVTYKNVTMTAEIKNIGNSSIGK